MFAKSELLDFINIATDSNFTLYNVDVGQPTVNGNLTEVVLTGKPWGGLEGTLTCQYQRTALADIDLSAHSFTLVTGHDIREVIPQLNALGWQVTADEFYEAPVSALVDGKFPLTAKESSYRYSGSINLTITLTEV